MKLLKFAFVSRHVPTQEQNDMARSHGIELHHVGDVDAFTGSVEKSLEDYCWKQTSEEGRTMFPSDFVGLVVVHPALALRYINEFSIGVFENENRAAVGEKPQFFPKSLFIMGRYAI